GISSLRINTRKYLKSRTKKNLQFSDLSLYLLLQPVRTAYMGHKSASAFFLQEKPGKFLMQ
uniref:hypothetical protein n=1 Tax=Alistipes shahii TaxID=328814 RepID=UPI00267502D7